MNKKEKEQWNQQKSNDKFNNITQKKTPENQNQEHNVKQEGIAPKNQAR